MRSILVAAFSLFAFTDAAGATTPAPVEDYSDALRHPYQVFANSGTCQYQGDCVVLFPATTNARTLRNV
jgi:hypothetical protein